MYVFIWAICLLAIGLDSPFPLSLVQFVASAGTISFEISHARHTLNRGRLSIGPADAAEGEVNALGTHTEEGKKSEGKKVN